MPLTLAWSERWETLPAGNAISRNSRASNGRRMAMLLRKILSLRAKRSNPGRHVPLDCFVALRAPRNDAWARAAACRFADPTKSRREVARDDRAQQGAQVR